MNEISRGLETPYYEAVITSYQEIDEMNGHVRTAHEMIALATRQRGFLGLETSRSPSGKPVVVSYWTSLDAVEAWQARGDATVAKRNGRDAWYDYCGLEVYKVDRPPLRERMRHLLERTKAEAVTASLVMLSVILPGITGR